MIRPGRRRGSATLELALCLPVLLVLALAMADIGLAIYGMSRLSAAVAAGARYATMQGARVDAGTVKTLIQAAASSTTATVGTSKCYCIASSDTGPALVEQACSDSCPGTGKARNFAVIDATWTYSRLTPATAFALPASFTISARVPLR